MLLTKSEMSNFKVISQDAGTQARLGLLNTICGQVQTPLFMPVGTTGAVKGITPQQLKEAGTSIILANTYHMLLRPGIDNVEKLGGLHKLMAWDKPILTDSGGYQVFSLSRLTKVDDEGVEFASHIDGRRIRLDPQIATNIQNRLGGDIIMCFDQCTPFPCDDKMLEKAVKRTIRWASECKKAHTNSKQLLFGIVQGGINLSLRSKCTAEFIEMDFDGYAIGGLSVGEGHDNMIRTVEYTAERLPVDRPRYLMGVGMPADIIAAVRAGIDMFDCVLPTRNGRNAYAFTNNGPLKLRNSTLIGNGEPVEAGCECYCCKNFTRGALRHFFNVGEMLGPILLSLHNIWFYQRLMAEIRVNIEKNRFNEWAAQKLKRYEIFKKEAN
jgi:queuine tRNA-ribosyltransferase